jgi:hypothetical protein
VANSIEEENEVKYAQQNPNVFIVDIDFDANMINTIKYYFILFGEKYICLRNF